MEKLDLQAQLETPSTRVEGGFNLYFKDEMVFCQFWFSKLHCKEAGSSVFGQEFWTLQSRLLNRPTFSATGHKLISEVLRQGEQDELGDGRPIELIFVAKKPIFQSLCPICLPASWSVCRGESFENLASSCVFSSCPQAFSSDLTSPKSKFAFCVCATFPLLSDGDFSSFKNEEVPRLSQRRGSAGLESQPAQRINRY